MARVINHRVLGSLPPAKPGSSALLVSLLVWTSSVLFEEMSASPSCGACGCLAAALRAARGSSALGFTVGVWLCPPPWAPAPVLQGFVLGSRIPRTPLAALRWKLRRRRRLGGQSALRLTVLRSLVHDRVPDAAVPVPGSGLWCPLPGGLPSARGGWGPRGLNAS